MELQKHKIGVIIPDRGDRPQFTERLLKSLPAGIEIAHVNYPPLSSERDITQRYRKGYDQLRGKGLEMIVCMENDDWYHPDYLSLMLYLFRHHGSPEIFGIDHTYYYHLRLKKWFRYDHPGRASMMSTCLTPDMNFNWPPDAFRFLDMYLWRNLSGVAIHENEVLSISFKGHGRGKSGGTGHHDKLSRYVEHDNGFLKSVLDEESFQFYDQLSSSLQGTPA